MYHRQNGKTKRLKGKKNNELKQQQQQHHRQQNKRYRKHCYPDRCSHRLSEGSRLSGQ